MLRNGGSKYHGELQYLGLLKELVDIHDEDPTPRDDRTGTGTFSVFGRQIRFDLAVGFPLLTTKEVNFKAMVAELLWMLSGSTNINDLDAKIWNQWADENGDLGPVYGKQWRDSQGIDQIDQLIQNLKDKPNDRGHVVSAWNVGDLPDMALRPCHCLFQFYVQDGKLSCQLYQRSADIFLGVPFNIASYALLTHLIARECGLEVGEFVHTFGDLHLYANHVVQAKEQLTRTPTPFPHLSIDPIMFSELGIFGILPGHISVDNYRPSGPIKAEVSV
jgi:thymidylate synthase